MKASGESPVPLNPSYTDDLADRLYGAYEHTDDEFAAPRFGHPKDRRPDLKQVQAGVGSHRQWRCPVFHRAYDGGAGENAQVVGATTSRP
jgi:transposase